MAESLIQRFLDAGMFDIGEDDDRLACFQKAADDLAKIYANSPTKIIPAILTAIDPNVPANEPLLVEAETAVKAHWKAFSNKYPERPKELLRPVVLEALAQQATQDETSAAVIWLSGSNLLDRVEQTKDGAIVAAFLQQCGEKAEATAVTAWSPASLSDDFAVPKLVFKLTAPNLAKIDRQVFQQQLQQHRNQYQGIGLGAAEPIASTIEQVVAPLFEYLTATTEQLKKPLKEFGEEFRKSLATWVNNTIGTYGRRTELLWWKQSLYSPSLRRSYRGLSPATTVLALAEDLKRLCPHVAPQSLEYFLRETVIDSLGGSQEFSLNELLQGAKTDPLVAPALESEVLPANPERICLLTAARSARQSLPDAQTFPIWLGIASNFKLPAAEWAVWLFRDAQALALSAAAVK